jgi:SAM-dependent methyltransferase
MDRRERRRRLDGADEARVGEAVENVRRRFPHIRWHIGDVRSLEFADGEFDAVYSPGVVEHFEEGPRQILQETWRVLRPGGFAIISTPCFGRWAQHHLERIMSSGDPQGDFYQYAFSRDGMKGVLVDLGFEVVQMRSYGVLDTLMRYGGWRIPRPLVSPIALALDHTPGIQAWGSTCIWMARKR